jgi:hypothetical protein
MKRMTAFAIASCLSLLMVAVPRLADQWNKKGSANFQATRSTCERVSKCGGSKAWRSRFFLANLTDAFHTHARACDLHALA